jgi:hypothetical protein
MHAIWHWLLLLIVSALLAGCENRVERPLKDTGHRGISYTHTGAND